MQNKQPLPFGSHYSASSVALMTYHDVLDFFIPLSATNVADTRFGDRFDYIHQMVIGVDTPEGYVLGAIAPHVDGMTYSLTGTDHAKFSISSTGVITLVNTSGFSAGSKSFNVVNNIYGTIPVTVPVVNGAGSYLFYDTANGNDSNAGTQPHIPKLTLPVGVPTVGTIYLKRGSTFTKTGSLTPNDGKTYRGYGNPIVARPKIVETSQAVKNMSVISVNNVAVYDIDFVGGQRGISVETATTLIIKRCKASNSGSVGDNNSQGFYIKGVTFPTLKHLETEDCYGDGGYVVTCKQGEVAYNKFLAPAGDAGDCLQITDENNYSKRCTDLHVHHNIGDYDKESASVKGSFVLQGCTGCTYEHNTAWGHYFGHGIAGSRNVIRSNISFYAYMNPTNNNEFNMIGAAEPIDKLKVYDNTFMFTQRGFNLSGYSGNGFTEWDRADIEAQWNMILFTEEPMKSTERLTSNIKNNIFMSNVTNAFTFSGRGNTAATITCPITAFTNNGDGTGTFTTSQAKSLHQRGDTTVVSGMTDPTLNTTWTVTEATTNATFKVSGVVAQLTLTGQSGTATKTLEYATINNIAGENTFQAEVGTVLKNRPTISGTCQDGQTVTVSATLPLGHTAVYYWRINHAQIGTGIPFNIPALTSATADSAFGSQYNNLNKAHLSCVMEITNPKGMKSLITAIWSDGQVYKRVVA